MATEWWRGGFLEVVVSNASQAEELSFGVNLVQASSMQTDAINAHNKNGISGSRVQRHAVEHWVPS